MSDACLFCAIATGAIPSEKVWESDTAIAFRDIAPQAPVHCVVVSKTHTAKLSETEEDTLLGTLIAAVRETARSLTLEDYRVVINNGASAGQTVFHLHAHLLAGRRLAWPPG